MPRDPEENESSQPEPVPAETDNIESTEDLEQALTEEKQKVAEYLASWQRAQANFVNYKRRTEAERAEFNSYANANLILSLLRKVNGAYCCGK